jgi:hypothetical protein
MWKMKGLIALVSCWKIDVDLHPHNLKLFTISAKCSLEGKPGEPCKLQLRM